MAQSTEDFPEDLESDRDIQALSSPSSKLPTLFIIISAVGALLLLFILQLFSDQNNQDELEKEVFRPTTSIVELPEPPRAIEEETQVVAPVETEKEDKRFNPLELERLRQLALFEQQKLDLERERLEALEEARKRRLESEMLVVDVTQDDSNSLSLSQDNVSNTTPNNFNEPAFSFGGGADPTQVNELLSDPNERFLRDAGDNQVVSAVALKLENQKTLVTQGTFITGVLETAINSDLPGLIRAVVDKNIYGRTGELVVIPKGSRLIGRYRSGLSNGQSRVFVVWSRLERPDGVVADLGSPGTDRLGVSGLTGYVDNHYLERFGAATFLSIIGPVAAILADEIIGVRSQQTENILNGTQQSFSDTANTALQNSINRPPTIHVNQGEEITIFVNRDISFENVGVSQR